MDTASILALTFGIPTCLVILSKVIIDFRKINLVEANKEIERKERALKCAEEKIIELENAYTTLHEEKLAVDNELSELQAVHSKCPPPRPRLEGRMFYTNPLPNDL